MSAGFDNVPTFVTCNVPLATNSCTNSRRNSICFVFRVTPLREVIDFAVEESVYTVIFVLQFLISSSIVDFMFKASIVAMLIAYNFQLVRAIVVGVLDQNVKTAPSK